MTIPGTKYMKHNMRIYPRTWRWVFCHAVFILITGLVYLTHIGLFV